MVDCFNHGCPLRVNETSNANKYISYRCSLCGREETKEEPYCHCGALMDKEDEHEAG